MSKQMIISVLSQDRPGIVADITGAIYQLNGDLADLNQSVLCGYLTMILIATFDDTFEPEHLASRVAQIESATKLDVVVREMTTPISVAQTGLPPKTYLMTAQGLNRKGLVHGISSFCYQHNINIMDLVTTRTEDIYTMILQLDLSKVTSILRVRSDLSEYAAKSGLQILMQHHDLFKVTNEISF